LRQIRIDIQALRALAVSLVVVFHFWPNLLPGGFVGVDVFFVISGFLITGHLLHDVAADTFSVTKFWARRIRRLLPASFFVLIFCLSTILLWASASDRIVWLPEVIASLGYVENWQLGGSAVDYLALGNAPSPVQHFWSLSVEEQFYFIWPLLILLVLWVTPPVTKQRKNMLVFGLILLTLSSFVFSIYFTLRDPALAYFITPTRVWEFAAGGLISAIPRAPISAKATRAAFTAGVLAIVASALVIKPTDAFPGYLAALPVLATALAVWSYPEGGLTGRLMAIKPVQLVGDISYSIYLWHWPILILTPVIFASGNSPSDIGKSLLIATTLALAWLTRRFVEIPFIAGKSNSKTFIAMASSIAILGSAAFVAIAPAQAEVTKGLKFSASLGLQLPDCIGATSIKADGSACLNLALHQYISIPAAALASEDSTASAFPDCPQSTRDSSEVRVCHLGMPGASIRIALVGDSHANQYLAAANLASQHANWRLDVITKGGCPLSFTQRVQDSTQTESCTAWVENVVQYLEKQKYDVVITSMKSGVEWVSNSDPVEGIEVALRRVVESGSTVLYIKDNPRPITTVTACLKGNQGREPGDCVAARIEAFKDEPAMVAVAKLDGKAASVANWDDLYCEKTECWPIIGDVIVYRDDNHLTNTWVKTLYPRLEEQVSALLQARG
jgi:peptidoglycan/LPS O-acetylase OafA/YrhL